MMEAFLLIITAGAGFVLGVGYMAETEEYKVGENIRRRKERLKEELLAAWEKNGGGPVGDVDEQDD
jgi:hypothetical protein